MLNHKGTKTIETPRLLLRQLTADDAEPMFRNWASDPAVTQYLTWPAHSSPSTTARLLALWCKEYEKPDYYQWAMVLKTLGEPIGAISCVNHRDDIGEVEIGYCMGKNWWHQGLMSEALSAVIDFFFGEVGMNRIEARHDIRNPRSGGVMRKCGMKYEGTARSSDRNNEGICDMAAYGILREDWDKPRHF